MTPEKRETDTRRIPPPVSDVPPPPPPSVADAVARMDDPALAVARPGDLVVFVLPKETDADVVDQIHNAMVARQRPAGVEFLVVCGPRVVVVSGGGA